MKYFIQDTKDNGIYECTEACAEYVGYDDYKTVNDYRILLEEELEMNKKREE